MKSILIGFIALYLSINGCVAQNFDGFVVTKDDSLFRGYMYLSPDVRGRKITMTKDKRKKPRIFYVNDLRYYAYKSDTFAILNTSYLFRDEDYVPENVEAKGIIMKGSLWLYEVALPDYRVMTTPGVNGSPPTAMVTNQEYKTFVIRDQEGNHYGVKRERKEFFGSLEIVLADDPELLERIRKKELKFKDMKRIITLYNSRKNQHEKHE